MKFILMYDTKKVAFFWSNKDPVPVNLQSHIIYQFECKAKYIGKTDRCLEFRLSKHSDFRTSTGVVYGIRNPEFGSRNSEVGIGVF